MPSATQPAPFGVSTRHQPVDGCARAGPQVAVTCCACGAVPAEGHWLPGPMRSFTAAVSIAARVVALMNTGSATHGGAVGVVFCGAGTNSLRSAGSVIVMCDANALPAIEHAIPMTSSAISRLMEVLPALIPHSETSLTQSYTYSPIRCVPYCGEHVRVPSPARVQ